MGRKKISEESLVSNVAPPTEGGKKKGKLEISMSDSKEEEEPISFTGKKSSKFPKKSGSLFSAAALLEEDDEKADSHSELTSVSKSGDDEDADIFLEFTGKKKLSNKKERSVFAVLGGDITLELEQEANDVEVDDLGPKKKASGVVTEKSKNKKKKKKGGKTIKEEGDLDQILAELGEGLAVLKLEPAPVPAPAPPIQVGKVVAQGHAGFTEAIGEKEGEDEGTVESAAAKKKRKKKEKQKEKKASAEVKKEVENDTKSKGVDKKLPKHVRQMQEALARCKEAEERKKKEEEEEEEEERLRKKELARQAELARFRKKEGEKEKRPKKKEGSFPRTAKQKGDTRRIERVRNQFRGNARIELPASDNGGPKKCPIYTNQKRKANRTTNDINAQNVDDKETKQGVVVEGEPVEMAEAEEGCLMKLEEKAEVANETEDLMAEMEEDDDEDWDAKSWDDTTLVLPVKRAYEDEKVDFVAHPVTKEEAKQEAQSVYGIVLSTDVGKFAVVVKDPEAVGKEKSKNTEVKNDKLSSNTQVAKSEGNLRSPICCIMGHVNTGKTKVLDCIRGTNVQEGEAGRITQQIGATYFPVENLREKTRELMKPDAKLNVPGLLVIDTPGYESFTTLRSRGCGLCDIAILVVDIMNGLEPQTIESLNLLRMRNSEFIVALNKVDRLYGWKTCRNDPIKKAMKQQSKDVQNEFNERLTQIITQFKEQGLNTELYYKNKKRNWGETYNIVPTSAISGEGVPDLLLLLVELSQSTMIEKLTFRNELQCTVLEVRFVEGHGTTIDVVLVNGVLHEGDQIVVCGMQGPIVTTIRALLTPPPMKELKVMGTYLHHKEIKAAQGLRITAQGLEHAIAGTSLYVVGPADDVEERKKSAMEDMESLMSRIDKNGEGVCVHASTCGSVEALLDFLESPAINIPVSGIIIGPVHKKDVMKASVMREKKKEFATIMAFDVKITPEIREYADEAGVKIFMADIIYQLFDQFKAYIDNIKEEKKREAADDAVFPCVLKILPNCVFNKKDPIVLGVDVLQGVLKMGTPLCIPSQGFIDIGRVASIENNHKPFDHAKKGQQVAIKIVGSNPEEQHKMFGRHFDIDDELVSHISRKSIEVLKAYYRDFMTKEMWTLLTKLKILFKIN